MKKNSKFWQGFLIAGITAFAVPSFVYGQSAGGNMGSTSGTPSSATRSGVTNPNSGTSAGMPGSAGTANSMSSPTTGMNQDIGSTSADQRLNSQIRQALNSDTSLAGTGRNVHLSTQNGKVTLQGSVNSEVEKKQIEQKVKQMSDVNIVDNQLQVANTTTSSPMGSGNR